MKTKQQPLLFFALSFVFVFLVFFFLPASSPTYAQIGISCPDKEVYIAVLDACLNFSETIGLTVSWALLLGATLALVKFAVGALQIVSSTGQPTRLENARATVTDAVLGFILIASAWVFLSYFSETLPTQWQIDFFVLPFGG